jgi:hypothetical protein
VKQSRFAGGIACATKETLCFQWFGKRFRLPNSITGDFFTATDARGSADFVRFRAGRI